MPWTWRSCKRPDLRFAPGFTSVARTRKSSGIQRLEHRTAARVREPQTARVHYLTARTFIIFSVQVLRPGKIERKI